MSKKFYHGSSIFLPVGTILVPQSNYEDNWGHTDFYHILEKYRPNHCPAHRDAVFMCESDEDIDLAGGGTEFVFIVEPLGPVSKHDLNWGSEISANIVEPDGKINKDVEFFAKQYWAGVPHHNESVWEYLTTSARIIHVEEF